MSLQKNSREGADRKEKAKTMLLGPVIIGIREVSPEACLSLILYSSESTLYSSIYFFRALCFSIAPPPWQTTVFHNDPDLSQSKSDVR